MSYGVDVKIKHNVKTRFFYSARILSIKLLEQGYFAKRYDSSLHIFFMVVRRDIL